MGKLLANGPRIIMLGNALVNLTNKFSNPAFLRRFEILFFLISLVFLGFVFYFEIFKFDYAVPPGDDGIRHMSQALEISRTWKISPQAGSFDPLLFHTVLAMLHRLTGIGIVPLTTYGIPALAILSVVMVFVVSRSLFHDRRLAWASFVLFALLSPQPQQIYGDGTYLNLVGALILLPLVLLQLPKLLEPSFKTKRVLFAGLTSGALMLTHSLTSIYFLMILGGLGIYLIGIRWKEQWWKNKNLWGYLGIVLLFVPMVWDFYLGGTMEKILSLVGIGTVSQSNILGADFGDAFTRPPGRGDYEWLLNPVLITAALLGLIFFFFYHPKKKYGKVVLLIWALALFLGSRSSAFQLPHRFARDLAMPVAIFAGIFVVEFYRRLSSKPRKIASLLIFVVMLAFGARAKMDEAKSYNPLIRVQKSDEAAMAWIRAHTSSDDVMLGVPRTIVAGDWGSFIELMTERKTLDGTVCPPGDEPQCDPIYHPETRLSLEYYRDESIDYVYSGKIIYGSFVNKDSIDWSYPERLASASFLEPVAEFPESKALGSVRIFKVNQEKLNEQLGTSSL